MTRVFVIIKPYTKLNQERNKMEKQPISEEMVEAINERTEESQEREFLNSSFESYERRCGYDD
mgnify:CR=1 FL=1